MWCDPQELNGQKHFSDHPFLGQQNYKQPPRVLKRIVGSSFTGCVLTAALGANCSLQSTKPFSYSPDVTVLRIIGTPVVPMNEPEISRALESVFSFWCRLSGLGKQR